MNQTRKRLLLKIHQSCYLVGFVLVAFDIVKKIPTNSPQLLITLGVFMIGVFCAMALEVYETWNAAGPVKYESRLMETIRILKNW